MKTRQQFCNSKFVKINVLNIEKKLLHRNRIVLEVVTDTMSLQIKKTYGQIKKFSEILEKQINLKGTSLDIHLISDTKQYQDSCAYFQGLNQLMMQNPNIKKYVYDFVFHEEQEKASNLPPSPIIKKKEKVNSTPATMLSYQVPNLQKITKNINSCWVKFGKEWHQYGLRINQDNLMFTSMKNNDKTCVILSNCKVNLDFEPAKIDIYNYIDKVPLQLRLQAFDDFDKAQQAQKYDKYLALYSTIKTVSQKFKTEVLNKINIALQIKNRRVNQDQSVNIIRDVTIKITHQQISTLISLKIDSHLNIHLPILNNYGKLSITIYDGKDNIPIKNRQIIYSLELHMQSIYDMIYNQKPKKKIPEAKSKLLNQKNLVAHLTMDYLEISNIQAYYSFRPEDAFEGYPQINNDWNVDDYRIQVNRARRLLWSLQTFFQSYKDLLNFVKPNASYAFYCLLVFIILLFDGNYLLSWILLIFISLMVYHHPYSGNYGRQILQFFKQQNNYSKLKQWLNKQNPKIRNRIRLSSDLEKQSFLASLQLRKRKKRSFYKKYQRFQEILVRLLRAFNVTSNQIQKLKNLITWYHFKKSYYAFIFLLLLFIGTVYLPLRIIFLGALVRKFFKGKKHYASVLLHNRIIVNQIIKLCINQNPTLQGAKIYLLENNRKFDKKSKQWLEFEKKFKQYLETFLRIDGHNDIFIQTNTMWDLVEELGRCNKRYVIPLQLCKKHGFNREWSYRKSGLMKVYRFIYGYLSNIPSDKFIFLEKQQQLGRVVEQLSQSDSDQEFRKNMQNSMKSQMHTF